MNGKEIMRRSASNQTSLASRRAMTLVELLASITLSTLLMSAVVGVLTTMQRNQKVLLENHAIAECWQTQLDQILLWDLSNSRSLEFTEDGVKLTGFAGRDLSTRIPIHCPCEITYEIIVIENHKHLFRRETHVELLDLDNFITELICPNVGQITIGPPSTQANLITTDDPRKGMADGPIPNQVSVTLQSAADARIVYRRDFSIR